MIKTTLFTKARNAALVSLALGSAAAGAFPSQAATLVEKQGSHDCQSRSEVKARFIDVGLTHVDVSRTSERYLYRVIGYKALARASLLSGGDAHIQTETMSKDKDGRIRFVVLYDACDETVLRQITPSMEVGAVFE